MRGSTMRSGQHDDYIIATSMPYVSGDDFVRHVDPPQSKESHDWEYRQIDSLKTIILWQWFVIIVLASLAIGVVMTN